MSLELEILPTPQRELWDHHLAAVPTGWVLYGGTAIALRFGHRQSIDFDFFSDLPLEEDALRAAVPCLQTAQVLHRAPNTLDCLARFPTGEVKLSFFGGIGFGRVSRPEVAPNGVELAGLLDLLGVKLKVLLQRVEAKDYLDIDALLRSGLSLSEGLAAAAALFPRALNPLDAVKAVTWFKDGDLETRLPADTKRRLAAASMAVDPSAIRPLGVLSERLTGPPPPRAARPTKRTSPKKHR